MVNQGCWIGGKKQQLGIHCVASDHVKEWQTLNHEQKMDVMDHTTNIH